MRYAKNNAKIVKWCMWDNGCIRYVRLRNQNKLKINVK